MSIDRFDIQVPGCESDCCGATVIYHDICESCGEHCEPEKLPELSEEQLKKKYLTKRKK